MLTLVKNFINPIESKPSMPNIKYILDTKFLCWGSDFASTKL